MTPVTVDELATELAREMMIDARQQAANILSMAYDIAKREAMDDANEITRSRTIQVIHWLCDEKHISKNTRDDILQSLGFEEMDPV